MNMLGAQALGVASLKEGQLEIMLDRRLNQDDGRGLFQVISFFVVLNVLPILGCSGQQKDIIPLPTIS